MLKTEKLKLGLLVIGIIFCNIENIKAEKLRKDILVQYRGGYGGILTILKDGKVYYSGGEYNLIDTLTKNKIDSIIKVFNLNKLFSLNNDYRSSQLKIPPLVYTLTYNSDSGTKTVTVEGERPEQILKITSELNARIEKLKVDEYALIIEISQSLRDRLLSMVPPPCPNKTPQQGVNDTISIQLELKVDENRKIIGEPQIIITTGYSEWDKEIIDFIKSKWKWSEKIGVVTSGSITIRFYKVPNLEKF